MIINDEGNYTLRYTATDSCGNSTVVDRELVVEAPPTYRTVLYTDGTFIINESSVDEAANIQAHGAATNVYIPFDPNGATVTDKYIFISSTSMPWNGEKTSILRVEIGSQIQPTKTDNWFNGLSNCTSMDLSRLDLSLCTSMGSMFKDCIALTSLDLSGKNANSMSDFSGAFKGCSALTTLNLTGFISGPATSMGEMFNGCTVLTSLDLSGFNTTSVPSMKSMFRNCKALANVDLSSFDTSNVTNMNGMFYSCDALTSLDLSNFNTNSVTDMQQMFWGSDLLETIYASANFVVTQVTASGAMFSYCNSLVGGAGTTWNSSNPIDKTYAHIDGGVSDPGYFTAKN